MTAVLFKKGMVIAIILLFAGISVIPSMGGMISELSSIKIIEADVTSGQSDSVKSQNSVYVINRSNVDYINIQDVLNAASNSDTSNHHVVNQISRATGIVLIIDDDNDIYFDDDNSIERFESVMGNMGYIVTNESASATDNSTWSTYDCIVWSCGDDATPLATESYRDALEDYVNHGGCLIIEGGHIARHVPSDSFKSTVLHATTDFVYSDVGDMTFKELHPVATTPNILHATIGFTATHPGDYSGDADAVRGLDDATGVYGWSDVRWGGSSVIPSVIESCNSVIAYDDDGDVDNGGQIVYFTIDIDDINDLDVQNKLIENVVTWVVTKTNDVWVDDDYNAYTPGWNVTHFDNIQDAIDAVAENGNVYVYNGTYHENVIVNKTIDLIGENRDNTYIDGSGSGDVVYISADYVDIMEFAIGGSGSGSYNAGINVISSNNNIAYCNIYLNYGDGIRLSSSSGNTISNCDIFSNGIVVYRNGIVLLSYSNDNVIINCDVWNNGEGIDIFSSSNNDIVNCSVHSNIYRGIYIDVNSNGNLVKNSDMLNNGWGIIFYASYNTIQECDISGNDYGTCFYASYNTIQECDISGNGYGVSIYASYNTIQECDISGNDYGIYSYSSHHDNHIYHNNIVENAIYQAYDSGSNVWDDGFPSGGNYFDDFEGVDNYHGPNQDIPGSDGIGDTPYPISGGSNQDNYPFMNPNGWLNSSPIANFTYLPSSPTDLNIIQFTDTSTGGDGTITSWSWEFGDGDTSTLQNPTHQYTDDGSYLVNLTVTDDDGASDTIQKIIIVSNVPPVADFSYTPLNPTDLDTIQFTDLSYDLDGFIVNWTWDFGDGNISYLQNPTHQYTSGGNYTMILTICDDDDDTDTVEKTITVSISMPEILDQEQTTYTYDFAIYGSRYGAQSFKPTLDSLTRVELYVSQYGSPTSDLVVSIRDDPSGSNLTSVSVPAGSIPTSPDWVSFDFSDLSVTPGNTYYIVMHTTGGSYSQCYKVGFAGGDPYADGSLRYSSDSGSSWSEYSTYDFTFKTYGGGGAPPTPVLSCSPTSHDFGNMLEGVTDSTTFDIWNSGSGTLTYSLSESCDWVDISSTGGTSSGEHDTITVDIDTTGLSETSYSCDITINSDGGSGTFTVDVNVIPPSPILSYSPTSHDFGNMLEGVTDSTTFDIWNSGSGTLTYSLSESCDWVDISSTGGTSSGEHDTITVDIDTTGLSETSYSCDIDITSNGGSGTFTVDVNIVAGGTEELDQEQTTYTYDFAIYGSRYGAQSFKPTLDSLTRVELYVSQYGSPTSDLVVSICDDPSGSDLTSVSVPAGSIPTSPDWVSFDLPDLSVTPGSMYYIVMYTTGGSYSQCYKVGFAGGNPYMDGSLRYSSDSGSNWVEYSTYDFTFKTYGGGGAPPTPVLAYSPTSHDFGNMLEGTTDSTTFDIWNSGSGTLTYSLSESCGWVDISSTGGTSSGEHDTITVDIDTSGLSESAHQCIIDITSDGGSGTFTVDVNVIPPSPILSYSPTSHNFGNMLEGTTDSTTFDIWNSGSGTLTYSLSESCTWIDVTPTGGTSTGEHDTITVNINTAGLSEDAHSCDIDITSDGGSGTFTVDVNIVAGGTEELDQEQTTYTYDFAIYGSRYGAQSFKPTLDSLTRVELYVSQYGSPTSDLVVSIRDDPSGSDLTSVSVPAGSIPTSSDWVSFDFSDLSVTPGNIYYIVMHTTGGSYSQCYKVGFAGGDPYADGSLRYSSDSGSSWVEYSTYDFTFKTYGGGGAPPTPVLSYSPISHDFGNMLEGVTDSTTFDIWNSGTGTLTYSLSESCTWIDVTPTGGTSTGEHDTITVNINTAGLSEDAHSCDIDITSDGGSGTFTVDVNIVAGGTEELDQEQTTYTYDFAIYDSRYGAQSFKPTLDSLTRVELYVSQYGSPTSDLVVSIRDDPSGSDLTSISVPSGDIPTSSDWVSFDFSDLSVTPGITYYLVMHTSGGSYSQCYKVGFAGGDPYADGSLRYSSDSGSIWTEYTLYDFCFKTYGNGSS